MIREKTHIVRRYLETLLWRKKIRMRKLKKLMESLKIKVLNLVILLKQVIKKLVIGTQLILKQTGHSTTPPREDNVVDIAPTLDDFKVFERTLTEKQLQLTKQTDMLNKILEEYSNIKESKTKKIDELKNEKKVLEIQKQKFLDEINNINKHVKDLDEQINTSEKDLVQQLKSLQKKAEPFQTRLHH